MPQRSRKPSGKVISFALWLLLFAIYAATIGGSTFVRLRVSSDSYNGVLFPALIDGFWDLGGKTLAQLLVAAVAAATFTVAAAIGRRIAPDPWATVAALVVALSPPAIAFATASSPALLIGGLLSVGVLSAIRTREHPVHVQGFVTGLALAPLPWIDPLLLIPAIPIAWCSSRWLRRRGQSVGAIVGTQLVIVSTIFCLFFNERFFGALTPYSDAPAAFSPFGVSFPFGYLERSYRLVSLWIDKEYGLLRWAPVLVLALGAVWLLWRSLRDRIAKALPERREAEIACGLVLSTVVLQLIVAVFFTAELPAGRFPQLAAVAMLPMLCALAAWSVQRSKRAAFGFAVLTLLGSIWVLAELLIAGGTWATIDTSAPFGPLVNAFPAWAPDGSTSLYGEIVTSVLAVIALLVLVREFKLSRDLGTPWL